tara:strand:+ start:139 stop:417 length:279 start_codon:yes stop_codon:yes gene_type:complete
MSNKQEFSIFDAKYSEILALLWFRISQDIQSAWEQFLFNQQWYRKRIGGKWCLHCHEKHIFWSQESDFVDVMAGFGAIVDVIKKEDWDVDKN